MLGITGQVRNLPGGEVYIVATGTEEQLHELTEWCRTGPSAARVESVETAALPLSSFSSFNIVR